MNIQPAPYWTGLWKGQKSLMSRTQRMVGTVFLRPASEGAERFLVTIRETGEARRFADRPAAETWLEERHRYGEWR
jgi:hypothetical protein